MTIKTSMLCLFVLLVFATEARAKQSFEQWKKSFAKRAAARGVSLQFSKQALEGVQIDPEVIRQDRNQMLWDPNTDYHEFIQRWIQKDPSRIERGREVLASHLDLLKKVEAQFGVDKEAIVALWGIESIYGRASGDYDLVRSLATLAHDGRRKKFFEEQLIVSLKLLKRGHVTREKLKGSWAGATGQCQFMPSNIDAYGKDFDGDGKINIWNSKADVFASIANYLKQVGWKKGQSIGRLMMNPETLTPIKWKSRRFEKILLKGAPALEKGANYEPMLRWNKSALFAAFGIILMEGFAQNSKDQ